MTEDKASPAIGVALAALDAVLVAGILSFAAPCGVHTDGSVGTCVWASRAMLGAAAVLGVIAIVRIFERDEGERRGLSLAAALIGVLVAVTPGVVIQLCQDAAMPCNAAMHPFALFIGAAIALTGGADLVLRLIALTKRG